MHADRLEVAAADLHAGHAAIHREVADIAQGFTGSPAFAAMNALLDHWEGDTDAHHKGMLGEAQFHRSGATSFQSQDTQSAQDIKSVDPQ